MNTIAFFWVYGACSFEETPIPLFCIFGQPSALKTLNYRPLCYTLLSRPFFALFVRFSSFAQCKKS